MYYRAKSDSAGFILFLDGVVTKPEGKYPVSGRLVKEYDEDTDIFEDGTFYWYLEETTPEQLNDYNYDLEIMEEDYRKWVETAMPFKHSGFLNRLYDDREGYYAYYYYYYHNNELYSIVHDVGIEE